ncbi:MAG: hypothetical protein WBR13_01970 [Allosphingosinicella sp.]
MSVALAYSRLLSGDREGSNSRLASHLAAKRRPASFHVAPSRRRLPLPRRLA